MAKKWNENIFNWINLHHATCIKSEKMVADVGLFANVWEIKEVSDEPAEESTEESSKEVKEKLSQEELDSMNPLYSGQSEKIKSLKKKKYWFLIKPIYIIYANVKVRTILFMKAESKLRRSSDRKSYVIKILNKIKLKWKNRKSLMRNRNRIFIKKITLSKEDIKNQSEYQFKEGKKFSVIVPLFNTPERYLRDMIESVQAQTYGNWELCLADGSDLEHTKVAKICQEYREKDKRILYKKLEKNEGIAENTNHSIEMATGDYIVLFDHDDMLHPAAFYRCMQEIEKENADFIYTDELTFLKDSVKNIVTLHFKPDYSPHNLKGVNYICHLCVIKAELFEKTGLYDKTYDGSQDHDMILKLTSVAEKVVHIPEILYFWRVHPQSVSMNIGAKSYAIEAGKNAVRDNEKRLGRDVEVFSSCICATHYRLEYEIKEEPLISIIIANHESSVNLAILLDSIYTRSSYTNYEIIILDFNSSTSESLELLDLLQTQDNIHVLNAKTNEDMNEAFRRAIHSANGEYVTFLESNMEVLDPKWMEHLVMYAMQPQVGIAGCRFVNSYSMLEEAGYIIGIGEDKIALPIEHHNNFSEYGYIGRMYYAHNVSAVSMWGMMARKTDLEESFMSEISDCYYAGIDFSLQQGLKNKYIVLNPYVIQLEKKKPLESYIQKEVVLADREKMEKKWRPLLEKGDPYYNPNFAKDGSFTYEYKL